MDVGALASALIDARLGQVQLAVAATVLGIGANSAASVTRLIDSAQQNFDRLANVAAGIGCNLDVSV